MSTITVPDVRVRRGPPSGEFLRILVVGAHGDIDLTAVTGASLRVDGEASPWTLQIIGTPTQTALKLGLAWPSGSADSSRALTADVLLTIAAGNRRTEPFTITIY